jgi:hypothetical protein
MLTAYVATAAVPDLSQDALLIIGTMDCANPLQYARNLYGGGSVTAAIVRDPSTGKGKWMLTPQEFV